MGGVLQFASREHDACRSRAAAGQREPYKVRYWGIGNESWGCGGNFTPEEYAAEYRRFSEWVPGFGINLSYIGAGPNGGELEWSRRFFGRLAERRALGRMWGWACIIIRGTSAADAQTIGGRARATRSSTRTEWHELIREADHMEFNHRPLVCDGRNRPPASHQTRG